MKYARMIVGLPASGKSKYIEKIAHKGQKVYDDVVFDVRNETATDIILAHPEFCNEKTRLYVEELLMSAGYCVETIFFQNDPEQCLENAKSRPEKLVNGYIKFLSERYNPPPDAIPVWREK